MSFIPLTLAPDSKGAPTPTPWAKDSQPQGVVAKTGNAIFNTMNNIGNSVIDAVKSGASDIQSGMSGQGNPFQNGLDIANGMATGAGAIFAPILAPISKGLEGNPAKGSILDKVVNSPEFQKFAMSPTGHLLSVFMSNTGKLANVAGATAGVGTGIDEVMNPTVKPIVPKSGMTPEAQLQSRIQDATPTYNEKMVGQNVMTSKGELAPRIGSEGGTSKFSNVPRPVTTSASETIAGTEANNIPNYPDKGTALEKMLSTQDAISTEAENMRGNLQAEDKASPLDTSAEKTKVSRLVTSNLPEDIQAKIGTISPDEETMLKGMNEKLGVAQPKGGFDLRAPGEEPTFPKTAAGRYYEDVYNALRDYDGTREGKLDLRQTIDSAYKQARGKLAFGSDSSNAIDEVNTDVRNSLNKDLADTTKNSDTQASLKRQSNLYNHKDVLTQKAQAESNTNFGKLEQKYPSLKRLVSIAQRQGIMLPIRIAETGLGVTIVGKYLHDLIYNKN